MTAPAAARVLALLTAAGQRGGELTLDEAAALLGIPLGELPAVLGGLAELGAPPFGPDDLVDIVIEDGWVLVQTPDSLAPPFPLTTLDATLLGACLRSLAGRQGGQVAERLRDAAEALEAALGVPTATGGTLAWASEGTVDAGLLDTLARAAAEGDELEVRFWNASRDRVEARLLVPDAVAQHAGSWYLIGRTPEGRRYLRIDRIFEARPSGQRQERAEPAVAEASVRRPLLFNAPSQPVRAEIRFARGEFTRARAWFPDAEPLRGRPGVLAMAAPTGPTLLRRLFAFDGGWEILAPDDLRALARGWAGEGVVSGESTRRGPEDPGLPRTAPDQIANSLGSVRKNSSSGSPP